jgi:predicted unusual protein kinase regulating ubiquinone biosynthesis (AarF/ABC1/UbiB family)
MTEDPNHRPSALLQHLVDCLAEQSGTPVPTSALGRLRRTAGAALRAGVGALRSRHGENDASGLSALDPEDVARLVLSLGELKGIAMKVGQMLSYIDTTMPSETRRLLAVLQVRSQPTAFNEIESTLRADLPADRAEPLLATLEREPVATASIGQVHRARLPDGTRVAVKVRHPGIEQAIRADFRSAGVGKRFAGMLAPGADITEIVAEAEARFLEECNYALEATRQQRFAELYASHPVLAVPSVHPAWSAARVLTTTWWSGVGFEAFLSRDPSAAERDRIGRALYDFYVGTLYAHAIFNADPHPGNLLFPGDGRVVVLDYFLRSRSCELRIANQLRLAVSRILQALYYVVMRRNADALAKKHGPEKWALKYTRDRSAEESCNLASRFLGKVAPRRAARRARSRGAGSAPTPLAPPPPAGARSRRGPARREAAPGDLRRPRSRAAGQGRRREHRGRFGRPFGRFLARPVAVLAVVLAALAAELRDARVERAQGPEAGLRRRPRGAAVAVDHLARLVARSVRDPCLRASIGQR